MLTNAANKKITFERKKRAKSQKKKYHRKYTQEKTQDSPTGTGLNYFSQTLVYISSGVPSYLHPLKRIVWECSFDMKLTMNEVHKNLSKVSTFFKLQVFLNNQRHSSAFDPIQ